MNTSEKQIILVPKNALSPDDTSRNGLAPLLVKAGYNKIRNGFDRQDQIEDGDFIFRGIKGPDALAAQLELFRGQSTGLLMGTDVLAEADLTARSYGVRSDIQKVLSLGIGPCSLKFLAPEENRITSSGELADRVLFTKYERILETMLRSMGIRSSVRKSEGADTRVNEWREVNPAVGALEIVGSGDTARKNRLQIVENEIAYPTGTQMGVPYLDTGSIVTNMYASSFGRMAPRTREMLRQLGLALDNASESNQYVSCTFNIPTSEIRNFEDFGMQGPTVSRVLSRDGRDWSELTIYAPISQKNSIRAQLLKLGAQDLGMNSSLQVEKAASTSAVLAALPFTDDTTAGAETVGTEPDDQSEVAAWLSGLNTTIAGRKTSTDAGSSTVRAFQKGLEFCAARYVNEIMEVSEALRRKTPEEAAVEAGQCVYWLITALQSRGCDFASVIPDPTAFFQQMCTGDCLLRESLEDATTALCDEALTLSTALRKGTDAEVFDAARAGMTSLFRLLAASGIDPKTVMKMESRR